MVTGGVAAALVLTVGGAAERVQIGQTDADARARAEREIQEFIEDVDRSLNSIAQVLAGRADVRSGMTGDRPAVRRLFEVVRGAAEAQSVPELSITIYDARGAPRAWHGRPAELARVRVQAGS
ncbi:MAG: hypothetical protein QF391_17205, partial [Myxococcota bacterium]|nr:hypothetical protein [Myxococcota bacterium]